MTTRAPAVLMIKTNRVNLDLYLKYTPQGIQKNLETFFVMWEVNLSNYIPCCFMSTFEPLNVSYMKI